MVSESVRYLFYQPVDGKIKTWTLRFPAKENPNMEKALFDWPIVLQYDVKPKYRLISRKFSSVLERSLNQPKATHVLYPFDKPIKSLYFRSFVVAVSFARFHFKDIRKSLYLTQTTTQQQRQQQQQQQQQNYSHRKRFNI